MVKSEDVTVVYDMIINWSWLCLNHVMIGKKYLPYMRDVHFVFYMHRHLVKVEQPGTIFSVF